jgi:hypothetical protein
MDIDKSLFIRGNRALGQHWCRVVFSRKVASTRPTPALSTTVRAGNLRAQGLLPILTHQLGALSENALLQYQAQECGTGLIDLHSYAMRQMPGTDPAACWATWTLPIDEREGVHFLASAYYLSQPARAYWEQLLGGQIVWYAASQQVLIEGIERLEGQTKGAAS